MSSQQTIVVDNYELIDFSTLNPKSSQLPANERQALYKKMTKHFSVTTLIDEDNKKTYKIDGLNNDKLGAYLPPISLKIEITSIIFFLVFMGFFFIPFAFIVFGIYLLYNLYLFQFIIYMIIYLLLIFIPIKENKEYLQNPILFGLFCYFGYRHVCHKETHEYIVNHHLNKGGKYNKPVIFISLPHGVTPFASVLSPLVSPDIFGTAAIGTVASILFYIPFIRHIIEYYGARSVDKKQVSFILDKLQRHVGLVVDGISGMFIKDSIDKELVLLKHRKGVAKLALQKGVHVVPTYGFGNTSVYTPIFDSYGILQWISSKLRISIILFYGRFYSLVPKRVPLYFVIGKPVYNKYCNDPIQKPTQQQIDEYHQLILDETKQMYNQHRSIYGWHNKELVFI